MKNTILWAALFTLIGAQVHADEIQQVNPAPASTAPNTNPAVPAVQPAPNQQPTQAMPVQPQAAPQPINCEYKIPADMKTIDSSLVTTWSEKASVQAFEFDPVTVDDQIKKLQPCFTEQGWTGFNSALQKSGNIEAIKTQKLTVSSQIDGQSQMVEAKDNQWKLTLPLQVVYQNDKEKVTQLLNISLTIGRKTNGDLGIMQMIATPRQNPAAQSAEPASAAPAAETPEQPTVTPAPAAPETKNQEAPAAATPPTSTPK